MDELQRDKKLYNLKKERYRLLDLYSRFRKKGYLNACAGIWEELKRLDLEIELELDDMLSIYEGGEN